MGRTVRALTVDRLADVVEPCRHCAFWERTPAQSWRSARGSGDSARAKRGWLTSALLEWGAPGRIVYVDDVPAGYLSYAPAHLVPRAFAFPTTPVSADAVLLITGRIAAEYAGQGLGRVLVQSAAKDLVRRRIRAIEAFGTTRGRTEPESIASDEAPRDGRRRSEPTAVGAAAPRWDGDGRPVEADALSGTSSGERDGRAGVSGMPEDPESCLLPVDFLTAVGFHTVRDHPAYPRLRLDLRTVLRWRAEVEQAVERLLTPVRGISVPPPVGTANRQGTPGPPQAGGPFSPSTPRVRAPAFASASRRRWS
ncbi:MAG: hypothetical protein V9G08_08390 [Dermatophilaceae bacterium]